MSSGISLTFTDARDNLGPAVRGVSHENVAQNIIAAHVVIDMDRDYLDGLDDSSDRDIAHHPIANRLIENINSFNASVDSSVFRSFVNSESDDVWGDPSGQKGEYDVIQKSFPNTIYPHTKRASSAFELRLYGENGDFHHFLQAKNVTDLYLSGINRSLCVWETALEAQKMGYRVHIIHDLTADAKRFTGNQDYPIITESIAQEHGIGWMSAEQAVRALNNPRQGLPLDITPPAPL